MAGSPRSRSRDAKRREAVKARAATARMSTAKKANDRGRAVPLTVSGYEAAASQGHARVAEALIARHNERMFNVKSMPEWYRDRIMSAFTPLTSLTVVGDLLKNREFVAPGSIGTSSLRALDSGIESLVAAMRLLLCGQIAGAAIIARNQIETWTEARAFLTSTTRQYDEHHADYIARTWSRPMSQAHARAQAATGVFDDPDLYVVVTEPDVEHTHIRISTGEELCPAGIWGLLSEVLHGRDGTAVSFWDASCLVPEEIGGSDGTLHLVLDGLRVGMFHMRGEMRLLAIAGGLPGVDELLRQAIDEFSEASDGDSTPPDARALPQPTHQVAPPLSFMAPLAPGHGLTPRAVAEMASAAKAYELIKLGRQPAGRLYRDDEFMTVLFGWYRFRRARVAQAALDEEKRAFPELFDEHGLAQRLNIWGLVTESAALMGLWQLPGASRDAALLAASTLRSAWWLWLEDNDRAMSVLRTVLEQVARMRVWRLKPEKARKLESRSTPRDWLEAAGWKRLALLNTALGEFAHVTARADWEAARTVLTDIQNSPDRDEAPFTARRSALELVTSLLAIEVCDQATLSSSTLAAALQDLFHEVGAFPHDEARYINERLQAIHNYRMTKAHSS